MFHQKQTRYVTFCLHWFCVAASKGLIDAAHFCYLMAQVGLGVFTKKSTKMVLIGSNHRLETEAGTRIPQYSLHVICHTYNLIFVSSLQFALLPICNQRSNPKDWSLWVCSVSGFPAVLPTQFPGRTFFGLYWQMNDPINTQFVSYRGVLKT